MADETVLRLGDIVFPLGSARGIKQTLEPISQATAIRRTINGATVNIAASQFRLYRSTISCSDQHAPTLDDIWPGDVLDVDCIKELSYPTATGAPSRDDVPGSIRTEGDATFYRPALTMIVMSLSHDTDEWGATCGWTITLEEVEPVEVSA